MDSISDYDPNPYSYHLLIRIHHGKIYIIPVQKLFSPGSGSWSALKVCESETYLDNLVPRLESLLGGRAARLDGRHKDAAVVAARQADADRAVLLEADEARLRPIYTIS